jgi:membrane protein YdbS with pleckstrin-like domain
MNQLSPQVKMLWSLSYLFRTILFSVMIFIGELLFLEPVTDFLGLPFAFLSLIILFIGVILSIIWPILRYNRWAFDVRENELFIQRGVITHVKTVAPFTRIQHLDVAQNPFERMLDLATLVIYTAGTRGADVTIPGLPKEYAEALRDQLKNITGEDAV